MEIIQSEGPLKPIGPYSLAVAANNGLVFCSGQIGIDPSTMRLVEGGVAREIVQLLDNMEKVLQSAGCTWNDVVRSEIFLINMDDFALVNESYSKRFTQGKYPARITIGVNALPAGAKVEMACIANHPLRVYQP